MLSVLVAIAFATYQLLIPKFADEDISIVSIEMLSNKIFLIRSKLPCDCVQIIIILLRVLISKNFLIKLKSISFFIDDKLGNNFKLILFTLLELKLINL